MIQKSFACFSIKLYRKVTFGHPSTLNQIIKIALKYEKNEILTENLSNKRLNEKE